MKVKNYKGNLVDRNNCRKIANVFYEIGDVNKKDSGECYKINGRYHRFNTGLIEFDHEANEYVLTNKVILRRGIIGFDGSIPILGYYSSNHTKNITVHLENGSVQQCIDFKILNSDYNEYYHTGDFYHSSILSKSNCTKIKNPPIDKNNLLYDSRFAGNLTSDSYKKYYTCKEDNVMINLLGDYLEKKGITFGLEFETSTGFIPNRLCYKHGLIPLKDGSIAGLEYVTVPLSGRKGLYNVMEICDILKERTKFDFRCSMHLHIGGIKREIPNILAVNNIASVIQEDIYALQPVYKKDSIKFGKSKNYSGPMDMTIFDYYSKNPDPNETSAFKSYFNKQSMGVPFSDYGSNLNNIEYHPRDPKGKSKWNILPRYCWFNTIPLLFTNKQTVEFRQHNNTFDFFKIFHFILTSALIVVAANEQTEAFLDFKFLSSLRNKKGSLETFIKYMLLKDKDLNEKLINSNIKYNNERVNIIDKMNKLDETGVIEYKYYEEFTNDIR